MGRLIDVVVAQRRHGRYSDGSSAWYGSWEETRTIKIHRDKLSTNKIHLHETGPGSSGISGLHFHKYYTWENKYRSTSYQIFKGSSRNEGFSIDSYVNSLSLPATPQECEYGRYNDNCWRGLSPSEWAEQQAAYHLYSNQENLTEDRIIQLANEHVKYNTSSFTVVIYDTEQLALATYAEVIAAGQTSINSNLTDTSERFKLICITEAKFAADNTKPSIAIQFKTSTTTLSGSTTEDASSITTQVNLAETNTFKSAWITVTKDGTVILDQDALPVVNQPNYDYLVSYTDQRNHFDGPGEYTVTVFAEDWSGNSRTETATLEVIGPPMTCNTWTNNSGIPADLIVPLESSRVCLLYTSDAADE